MNDREALRRLGQLDLGDHIQIATGEELWGKQKEIASAISVPMAQVVVPSCNASGKTWLAGRIVLAFYDAFTPGTPCERCDPTGTRGGCRGSKIITTSSKERHLKDNLWGEIRMAWPKLRERVGITGGLASADTRIEDGPEHFITGLVATAAEGFQGYHSPHILIVGDEATSVSEAVATGITGLLASGDARLLLILNPTDATTYAATKARSPRTVTIKITAYDTPNFTHEHMPEGAHLIHPGFLEDLRNEDSGPGTYEWTTRVCAEFWDLTDDTLIAEQWIQNAYDTDLYPGGTRSLGIDIASYGTAESVIAVRDGLAITELRSFASGRVDHFFQGPVTKAIQDFDPHYVIYDADGVGAGAIGYAEQLYRHLGPHGQIVPFRGAKKYTDAYANSRSAWYWALRKHFESGHIRLMTKDRELAKQLTMIRYSIMNGAIRIETKEEMRKRGEKSPDRADAVMYAFAFATDLPIPVARPALEDSVVSMFDVHDHSERAMWQRTVDRYDKPEVHPILGVSDW